MFWHGHWQRPSHVHCLSVGKLMTPRRHAADTKAQMRIRLVHLGFHHHMNHQQHQMGIRCNRRLHKTVNTTLWRCHSGQRPCCSSASPGGRCEFQMDIRHSRSQAGRRRSRLRMWHLPGTIRHDHTVKFQMCGLRSTARRHNRLVPILASVASNWASVLQ